MRNKLKDTIKKLVKGGESDAGTLYQIALSLTDKLDPRPEPEELEKIIQEVLGETKKERDKADAAKKLGMQYILDWVNESPGEFSLPMAYQELGVYRKHDLEAIVRENLRRLVERGILVPTGGKRGHYRKAETEIQPIDLNEVSPAPLDLYLPLGLHDWVNIYSKSIIVFAGLNQRGKTSLALDFAKNNMSKFDVRYFFSEGGKEELRARLDAHQDLTIDEWNVQTYERASNFEDAIFPDAVNVIDYLLIPDNFWLVAHQLDAIYKKLNKGIAFITIQKGRGAEAGRGGDFGLERPRLYVTLDADNSRYDRADDVQYGVAKVLKAKGWKKGKNPDGRIMPYSIRHGWEITPLGEWEYAQSYDAAKTKKRLF